MAKSFHIPRPVPMSGSHRKENKRNNYAKNYMALLTPDKRSPRISFSPLCLPAANLQIYMQGSCSIKSSKPDHKQGYFMPSSLTIFTVQEINSPNDELDFASGQWKLNSFVLSPFCDSKKFARFLQEKWLGKNEFFLHFCRDFQGKFKQIATRDLANR